MADEVRRLRETTSNKLSNQDVGISNIFERDLPDEHGVVRAQVSAILSIREPGTDRARRETVLPGSVVAIGIDRYCIVSIEEGRDSPGWVSLRRVQWRGMVEEVEMRAMCVMMQVDGASCTVEDLAFTRFESFCPH